MTTITTLPPAPSTSSPTNFDSLADTFIAALPIMVTEINSVATELNASNLSATNSAATATTKAGEASTSALMAAASANYKGLWSTLTGALNKPASVYHNSDYWALNNNLANVTTSVPGVSANWTKVGVSLALLHAVALSF